MQEEQIAEAKSNPFAVNIFEKEEVPYDHGIPVEQVEEIKQKKLALDKRIMNNGEPVSLDEFASIVIPWVRIHRTEVFILNPEKPKKEKKVKEPKAPKAPRTPREKVERVPAAPKEKKLTKKQLQEKMSEIIMKMAMNTATDEDKAFFEGQSKGNIL